MSAYHIIMCLALNRQNVGTEFMGRNALMHQFKVNALSYILHFLLVIISVYE